MERLTPLSAAFLQAEDADSTTSMAIASTAILSGPAPPQEELLDHIRGRLPLVPRFRQTVRRVPFDLAAPVWVDDPDTDVAWHVRRTALPQPGGPEELHRLIARVMSQRMDRTRPLWEYWVVEGLSEDRWAILQKLHHCMVDGVSGTALYDVIFDTDPVPSPPPVDDWKPQPAPTTLSLTGGGLLDLVLTPVAGLRAAGSLLSSPRTLARRAARTARGTFSLVTDALPVTGSSLSGPVGRQRRYTSTTVPFDAVRLIRSAFPGTVNDVALAAITGGFRALLLSRGEQPRAHAIRSLVPVSIRRPGEESIPDNRVSLLLPYLPVDVADPVAALATVRERIARAATSGEAEAGTDLALIAGYEPFPPVSLGVRLAFHLPQRQLATVTTNVPGPRRPIFLLGRGCTRIIPYVPIADRVRIGVAIFSYNDELTFGITGDYDTASDIDQLTDGINSTLQALIQAATSP
ncbi:wax ester/triacylglycerol synthase family O-acyltransferase [Nostocoides sp. F2B08]|uniref:wax ester/triacylglycerol synthase family O-acyltransferase n=1 Tax=Nostocoides sp. F2B08 TaxID=2653936 RepID=UPI001263CE61|nr:wax ester/triacylglycerol synthase family O-acyltransferase [Tetrasphaera sp. F2B08]KAB7739397.1 wax ester/triacylglycerol synthase family O-acyltransferase [Tetrasphaera sp. F2B08]